MMPTNSQERKQLPVYSGVVAYFPDALVEVARASWVGQQQHAPDQPLAWDRSKSGDELDALMRHLLEAGGVDSDGVRHSAKVAWRALAFLQKEIEAERVQGRTAAPVHRINGNARANPETPPHKPTDATDDDLRQRVQHYLEEWGTSIHKVDLGVGASTLHKFMNGKPVYPSTVEKIRAALDEREARVSVPDDWIHDTPPGDFLADQVNDYLRQMKYDVSSGAMALNVSHDALDSVLDGAIPHPNIINAIGAKLPEVRENYSRLKRAWLHQQEGA